MSGSDHVSMIDLTFSYMFSVMLIIAISSFLPIDFIIAQHHTNFNVIYNEIQAKPLPNAKVCDIIHLVGHKRSE